MDYTYFEVLRGKNNVLFFFLQFGHEQSTRQANTDFFPQGKERAPHLTQKMKKFIQTPKSLSEYKRL